MRPCLSWPAWRCPHAGQRPDQRDDPSEQGPSKEDVSHRAWRASRHLRLVLMPRGGPPDSSRSSRNVPCSLADCCVVLRKASAIGYLFRQCRGELFYLLTYPSARTISYDPDLRLPRTNLKRLWTTVHSGARENPNVVESSPSALEPQNTVCRPFRRLPAHPPAPAGEPPSSSSTEVTLIRQRLVVVLSGPK